MASKVEDFSIETEEVRSKPNKKTLKEKFKENLSENVLLIATVNNHC